MKNVIISVVLSILCGICFAQLPTDSGPYEVGCRMRTIERPSDTDTTTRVMDIYIWYPADPLYFYWVDEVKAYWNERPMQGDTARPVLFFSHGGCGHPLASTYYTSFLPSWGFIVIATMHPGSMFGDPDCLDSAALEDTWLNRPGDIEFTRRHFIDLAADSANLFGVFDTARMGMSGHSFGARTTYAMLNRTDYFLCGLAFSGNYIDRFGAPMNCMEDIRGVHQPIMIQNGTYDMGLPPDYASEIYDTLESPKYWAEIHRIEHFQWSDTCDPTLDPQCGADSLLDYAQAHYEILKYSVPFLMHYLMGDNRFDSYLVDTSDTFVTLTYENGMGIGKSSAPRHIDIAISPNPFNSSCKITAPAGAEVEIYDLRGNVVYKPPLSSNSFLPEEKGGQIGAPQESPSPSGEGYRMRGQFIWTPDKNISSGIYFVRVRTEDGNCVMKKIAYLK